MKFFRCTICILFNRFVNKENLQKMKKIWLSQCFHYSEVPLYIHPSYICHTGVCITSIEHRELGYKLVYCTGMCATCVCSVCIMRTPFRECCVYDKPWHCCGNHDDKLSPFAKGYVESHSVLITLSVNTAV